MSFIHKMSQTIHQASQRLHRVPAHHNLRCEYLFGEYQPTAASNPEVHTRDGHFIGLEDEIFTPTDIVVRRAQRQSQLLYSQTTQTGENHDEQQATAGASAPSSPKPPSSRFYTPYASFSAKRPNRPRPCNINTGLGRPKRPSNIKPALARALLALTLNPAKATDAQSAACAKPYGQQHLMGDMKFADVQILSRAGNVARNRRMG